MLEKFFHIKNDTGLTIVLQSSIPQAKDPIVMELKKDDEVIYYIGAMGPETITIKLPKQEG